MRIDANYPGKPQWLELCPCLVGGCPTKDHPHCAIEQIRSLQSKLDAATLLIVQAHAGLNHTGVVDGIDQWNARAQPFLIATYAKEPPK